MYYEVFTGGTYFKGNDPLTYSAEEKLQPGQIVAVSLRNRKLLGVVKAKVSAPDFAAKVRPVERAYPLILPAASVELLKWLQVYYPAPVGTLSDLFLPSSLPQKLTLTPTESTSLLPRPSDLPPLTSDQKEALKKLEHSEGTILLHGDTGNRRGETKVWCKC